MGELILDLCSGTKSATAAWRNAGYKVFTVDNNPAFSPDWCGDVRQFKPEFTEHVKFVWASPPCTEFAREFMPWSKTGNKPDTSIAEACIDIIRAVKPDYWLIENVKGSVRYFQQIGLGYPRSIVGPFFLWGNFPPLPHIDRRAWRKKETRSSAAEAERGAIPYNLSPAVMRAILDQGRLFQY